MGVFDGMVLRVTATRSGGYEDVRYAEDERHAKKIVSGHKGRDTAVSVEVAELHYAVHSRPDLSYTTEAD